MDYTAILCGYFSVNNPKAKMEVLNNEWEKIVVSDESIKKYSNYYYPEFVNFNFGKNASDSICRFSKTINKEITISKERTDKTKLYELTVRDITIYIAPHNILMYSIRINKNYTDLNDVTAIASILRNVIAYPDAGVQLFLDCAIAPILDIYKLYGNSDAIECNYSHLVENGNKFKIFQTVELPKDQWETVNLDVTLFEVGTLSPIGSYDEESLYSSSAQYMKDMVDQNSLSIYNNWRCLSLFDTYTILYCACPDWLLNNWLNDYFGMIYISLLYKRFYLFRANLLFRFKLKNIETLLEEFLKFERHHCFFNISYNFLPQEINKSIAKGLEIESEKKELCHMIGQENTQREKKDDERMNKLLFFLTCITVISVIWDASCLINELYPFSHYLETNVTGYRIVSFSFVLVVLFAMCIYKFFKKRS